MNKYCFFLSNKAINASIFESIFNAHVSLNDLTYLSANEGYFQMDSTSFPQMEIALDEYARNEEGNLSIVLSHSDDDFCKKLIKEGASYFPNRVVYLSDILFKFIALGDYSFIPSFKNYFRSIDSELLMTAGSYLRNGLDAKQTSLELNIHRNTTNYRLNRFAKLTSIDLRDYHNAILLELYFQIIA